LVEVEVDVVATKRGGVDTRADAGANGEGEGEGADDRARECIKPASAIMCTPATVRAAVDSEAAAASAAAVLPARDMTPSYMRDMTCEV